MVAALAALAAGAPVSSLPRLLAPQATLQEASAKGLQSDKGQPIDTGGAGPSSGRAGRQQRRQRKQQDEAAAALAAAPDAVPQPSAVGPAALGSTTGLLQPPSPAAASSATLSVAPASAGSVQTTAGFTVAPDMQSAAAESSGAMAVTAPSPARKAAKPARKGGLSLFLRGDLEKESDAATSSERPAAPRGWGTPVAAPAASVPDAADANAPATSGAASGRSSGTAVSGLTSGLARQRQEAESRVPEGDAASVFWGGQVENVGKTLGKDIATPCNHI